MKVDLFKQIKNFVDNDGNERTGTYFFVRCGDVNVPVQVTYFKSPEGDRLYSSRKQLLSAFATRFPLNKQKLEQDAQSFQKHDDESDELEDNSFPPLLKCGKR